MITINLEQKYGLHFIGINESEKMFIDLIASESTEYIEKWI